MLQWVSQFSLKMFCHILSIFTFRFSESLGRGGFGEVFKGKWREQPIAAKKIENTSFSVELKVSHLYEAAENILQLLAYSYNQEEGAISCLVFPYMENGSVFSKLQNGRL